MQLVRKSGEIDVQLQCFWNTIAMVLGKYCNKTRRGNKRRCY